MELGSKGVVFPVLFFCLAPAAYAAENPPGGPSDMASEKYYEMLEKRLKLEGAQGEKIKRIIDNARPSLEKKKEEMEHLRKRMRSLGEEMQKEMRASQETIRKELNADQKEQFDEMRVMMRRRMQRRDFPRRSGGGKFHEGPPPEMSPDRGAEGAGRWDGFELPGRGPREGLPEMMEMQPRRGRGGIPPTVREHMEKMRRMGGETEPEMEEDFPEGD